MAEVSRWWIAPAFIVAIVVLVSLDVAFGVHAQILNVVIPCVVYFQSRTPMACLSYMALYVAVSLSCVPLTPFEILTGFCFGIPLGIILDITGRVTGAALSFLAARALSHSGVDCPCVTGEAVMAGVGKAVEEHGFRFLLLFNLAPMPVAVKNYGLGFVPEVRLSSFILAIMVVEVPMASMWAFIGSSAASEVSAMDTTAVHSAIVNGGPGLYVKVPLLCAGVVSMLLVLRMIHKKVAVELEKVKQCVIDDRECHQV